ncbi:MAG: exopolysaccharide biosynthesis protein [Flavobacteriaceae bacterium]|nr:exopolysaccharide biosynthesis protein [Flavobacteriaceae bacterium]MBT6689722.1 exopolysaccharide biosynthesis protein [Flavobacteriaceae bacterium]MBT7555260.1 exopolysaccharide biosynthesis protein [Flavobacteriaceae bacterium]
MSEKNNHIEESISISFIVDSIKDWISFIFSKRKIIIRGTIIIMILIISYNYIKSPVHYARTTFVLDNDTSSGSMGDLSSLASLAGINASSFIDASSLFQIDNIQELYRSSSMLKNTLLSSAKINDKEILIIERFAKAEKLINKWRKLGINLEDFKNKKLSRLQDSLIKESIKLIKKEYLLVDKPSRKTTILEIGFNHKDELLAKSFNENLVSIVNKFYFDTKTLKTGANLEILKKQSDSVKNVLNESILVLAEKDQNIPNLNALDKVSMVPYQKAMIDVQANSAIYGEIVKQLELAKVTHRNNMPLIQIIDKPILPLENSRWKLVKTFFLSFIIGVSSIILGLSFKRIINYEQN